MRNFNAKSNGNSNGYGNGVEPSSTVVAKDGAAYSMMHRTPDYFGSKKNLGSAIPPQNYPTNNNNNNNKSNSINNINSPAASRTIYKNPLTPNGIGVGSANSSYSNGKFAAAAPLTSPSTYYYSSPTAGSNGQQRNVSSGTQPASPARAPLAANNSSSSSSSLLNSSLSPPDPAPQPQQYRTTTTTITSANGGSGGGGGKGSGRSESRDMRYQNGMERSPHPPHRTSTLPAGYGSGDRGRRTSNGRQEPEPPVYRVEHLASFAAGRQFGLQTPTDGVRKLKQMEKNSAVYAQPMIMKFLQDRILVEEENGTFVEQFWMDLIVDPTAHQSSDPADIYNNVLLFTVKEDATRADKVTPPEMHIFQCVRVSSQEVAEDLHHYIKGHFYKVRPGLHDSAVAVSNSYGQSPQKGAHHRNGYAHNNYRDREQDRDDVSAASNSSEYFEIDVNTLNRCFDDIERFVSRIQSAAIAQRELDLQHNRLRQQFDGKKASKKAAAAAAQQHERSILQLRAQMPTYNEFYELFQKFKLCLNLLAKLKDHIHEPNAPELLHFLFTPLGVALDACHWGLGRNVAEQVVSPLLTIDACELLRRCLTPKEYEVWMALGKSWRTPPEDWLGMIPAPYRPVFLDGFAPYGYSAPGEGIPPPQQHSQQLIYGIQPQNPAYGSHGAAQRFNSAPAPIHRGVSAPAPSSGYYGGQGSIYGQALPPQSSLLSHGDRPSQSAAPPYGRERSVDNLDLERITLEKERLEFERMKVLDREQQLLEQERRLRQEEARLEAERRLLHKEAEKHSIAGSDRPDFYRRDNASIQIQSSPRMDRRMTGSVQVLSNGHVAQHTPQPRQSLATSPRQVGETAGASYTNSAFDVSRPVEKMAPQLSPPISIQDQSPRQRAFFDELTRRRCKIVQVTYDRVAQNPKELTVARGEYLEVLNDSKNWWECRNVHNRLGYVPHTILSVVVLDNISEDSSSITTEPLVVSPHGTPNGNGDQHPQQDYATSTQMSHQPNGGAGVGGGAPPPGAVTGSNIINDEATPDYVKQRQGRRGEFRYF